MAIAACKPLTSLSLLLSTVQHQHQLQLQPQPQPQPQLQPFQQTAVAVHRQHSQGRPQTQKSPSRTEIENLFNYVQVLLFRTDREHTVICFSLPAASFNPFFALRVVGLNMVEIELRRGQSVALLTFGANLCCVTCKQFWLETLNTPPELF